MCGNHYREGNIIETGKVTSLRDADLVEVIVYDGKKKPQTHVGVNYTVGDQTFKTRVKRTATIAEFRESISYAHKGKPVLGIALGGNESAQEDSVEDWFTRSLNTPFQAVLSKMVQVILGWRGQELHMAARESWTLKGFKKEVKKRLPYKGHLRIEPQGLSAWEVRAGFPHVVMETRKMNNTLRDNSGRAHRIQMEGDKSLLDLEGMIRDAWELEPWIKVTVKMADDKLFWVEEKAEYTVVTQYDPSLDLRPEISVRTDLADISFIVDNYRTSGDPGVMLEDLSTEYGFSLLKLNQCHWMGEIRRGQQARITPKACMLCAVKLSPFLRRSFEIYLVDEPWK
jgi:hypothetical protein